MYMTVSAPAFNRADQAGRQRNFATAAGLV